MKDFNVVDDIDSVNRALAATGGKRKVSKVASGSCNFGNYKTVRYVTNRGAEIMIKFVRDMDDVYIKSVCSIKNKRKEASLLINGQACKNTNQVCWFNDGEGPAVK